jgi:hypothetical protein
MIKGSLTFFLGAFTVTSFVVATGARPAWLVALGFVGATVFYGLAASIIGYRRLVRLLSWIFGEREQSRLALRRRTGAQQSEVEVEVVSALIHQGASRNAAVRAAADAASQAPKEFEPLFKAAVAMLHMRKDRRQLEAS